MTGGSPMRAWLRRDKAREREALFDCITKHAEGGSKMGLSAMAVIEAAERLRRYHGDPPIIHNDHEEGTRWFG